MIVSCPNCGAPVEFRFDDSMVRVCGNCKNGVVRSDRGVESLGKVADLAPMASPLKLFAEGKYFGRGFLLIGKAQVKHQGGGVWQEWYAKFDDGRWGWIAEHQGKFSVAFEVPGVTGLPAPNALVAGGNVNVGAPQPYIITEIAQAQYVGAEGEMPFRIDTSHSYLFADMSDGTGGFATIDYGNGTGEPTLFAGKWVGLTDLGLSGGESIPASVGGATPGKRLSCPECNGAIDVRVPDAAMRVTCPYCNQLISTENGVLSLLGKLAVKPKFDLPLGTKAKFPEFAEVEFTIIGAMRRSFYADYVWYPFDEYLLHHPSLGFRWLVCSDGHWGFAEPVDTASTKYEADRNIKYEGKVFKAYAGGSMRVDAVYGEFYWRVAAGSLSSTVDTIRPPQMISREVEGQELNTSLTTYLTIKEVRAATGVEVPDNRSGVAPHQPQRLPFFGWVAALSLIAMAALGILFASMSTSKVVLSTVVSAPPGKPQVGTPPADVGPLTAEEMPGNAFFTDPFVIAGGKNISVEINAGVSNSWAYVVVDLVDESTGTFVAIDNEVEYYNGVEDGYAWSEGSTRSSKVVKPIKGGTYVARIEVVHGDTSDLPVSVTIRQNVFQGYLFLGCLIILVILLVIFGLVRYFHQRSRWENSGFFAPPLTTSDDDGKDDASWHDDDEDDDD